MKPDNAYWGLFFCGLGLLFVCVVAVFEWYNRRRP